MSQPPYGGQYDPQSGAPYDPQSGAPYNPQSGAPYNPQSGPPYGQQSGAPYGQPYGQQPYGQPSYGAPTEINNNLTMAIIGLLLFWPVGLFALINATKVNGLVAQGNIAGAQEASEQARKLGKIAIIVGAALLGVSILGCCGLFAIGAIGAGSSSGY
jgi:hypothetical protein